MKNKLYNILFPICFLFVFIISTNVKAEGTIYYQTFDSVALTLPSGWSADANGWSVDSVAANADTIQGASEHQNVKIANATGFTGTYNLYSPSISTVGYNDVSVLWAARLTKHFADSGSTIQGFYYSTDNGGQWNNVPYTENANNSGWYYENGASRISLPVGAANQASVEFKWVAVLQSTSSGTYRIDDFSVEGNLANGVREYKDQNAFQAFVDGGKLLHLNAKSSFQLPASSNFIISDVTGRVCMNENISSNNNTFSLTNFKPGVYLIKVTAGDIIFTQKIVCN